MNGVFCPNESSTYGMLQSIQNAGLGGKVVFVGFDTSAPLISGLQDGIISGLIAQNPFNMGYLGVLTVKDAIDGKIVPKVIDTGCILITGDNLMTKEVQDLLNAGK